MTTEGVQTVIDEAVALIDGGDLVGAARLADDVRRFAPDDPETLNLEGLLRLGAQELADAASFFERAIEKRPNCAAYRVNHAYALITAGRFDDARRELNAALALEPDNVMAFQNLAGITQAKPGDAIIDSLRTLKAKLAHSDADFARVSFALGKCLDDIGDYDGAFAAINDANLSRPSTYDPVQHEAFFARVKAVWTRDFIARHAARGHESRKAVFIVGMPRSGSTLLEDRLASRPDVVGLGEIGDIISVSNAMQRGHPRNAFFPDWCLDAPPGSLAELGRLYVKKWESKHPTAKRFINKALANFPYVGLLAAMLPQSLVIDSRRDAADTCLSCYFKDLKPIHSYARRLDTLGHAYRLYVDVTAHWAETADNVVTIRHEDFVATPDASTKALWRAMGLDSEPPKTGAPEPRFVQTFSAWQIRQPITPKVEPRWKRYEKHLGPLFEALGDLAQR